jgi:hypothetical protein
MAKASILAAATLAGDASRHASGISMFRPDEHKQTTISPEREAARK